MQNWLIVCFDIITAQDVMENLPRDLFIDNMSYLTERLNPNDIIDHLISKRMVGRTTHEFVYSQFSTPTEKNRRIIKDLSQGDERTVKQFFIILRKSRMTQYIAEKLEKG